MRFCCKGNRPWETKMAAGQDIGAPAILNFERPFRCPVSNCKCCCYQEVMTKGGDGAPMGNFVEKMWFCVPDFAINNEAGNHEYDIHQPTCCGGAVVNCCAQGCCNCRIPFLIYPGGQGGDEAAVLKSPKSSPVPGMEGAPDAQICKIWSGLATELFTDADTFEVKAPDGSSWQQKSRLIGATLLLNQVFFEGQDGDGSN